ncbi:MAG: penicillin-binding protein activator [Spongiibacteraceae bacterium]
MSSSKLLTTIELSKMHCPDYAVKKNRATQQTRTAARHHNALIACMLAFALSSCSATPQPSTASNANQTRIRQLLDKAHASPLDMRAAYLIEAATLAQPENPTNATQILREIDELKLTPVQYARRQLLKARLALQQNQADQALTALQDKQVIQALDQLTTAEQADCSLLRAQAFYATGNYFASAQERVFVEPLLSDAQVEKNRDEIRRALSNISTIELQRHRTTVRNDVVRGWLDLAIAAKETRTQSISMAPAYPAATQSAGIGFSSIGAEQPQQVALLLPLSGKLAAFGEAVRDGFLAASYSAQQRGERIPTIRIYDSDSAGIIQIYQQAITDGAGAIVGPLEKLQVAQFYSQTLTVPVLALNRADIIQPPPSNLYQFGLAPEDESAQLAQLIAKDGKRNVLIIADRDEANSRELEAFMQQWRNIGGSVAGTALFRGQQDLSNAIRSAMNIPRSEARGKEMEAVLNRNIEFTPHRRRDVDAIFMLAKSTQARLIKPLLNFYYAGDLPVYSTSRIYSGYASNTLDRDIERVRFTETPWILQASPLKQQILATTPTAKNYLRLYALGIDSFYLYPRLRQLESSNGTRVAGQTGTLTLDAQRIVQRELLLAQIRDGAVELRDNSNDDARESDDVLSTITTPETSSH